MPSDRARHGSNTSQFDIIVVPVGEGGKSRSYRLTRLRLWLGVSGLLAFLAALILAVLLFTPLLSLIPIPSSVLEQRYGRQLLETQKELRALAEELGAIRAYNDQLRMVLGTSGRDSVTALAESEPHTPVQMAPGPTASLTESTLVEEYGNYEGDIGSFTPHVPAQPAWRSSLPLAKPVSGVVTQTFYPAGGHFGIDYATSAGTPVFSSADGFVIFSGWTYDDGNMIMISHAAGFMTVYKHNQSLLKPQNASVREGDVIALVGSSGRTSKGPHLHFEVWKDGLPVDPDAYLLVHSRMPTMF